MTFGLNFLSQVIPSRNVAKIITYTTRQLKKMFCQGEVLSWFNSILKAVDKFPSKVYPLSE